MFRTVDLTVVQDEHAGTSLNWMKCVLCQTDRADEKLICPAQNLRGTAHSEDGYETLAGNLIAFHEIGSLPFDLNIERIDDGSGLKTTFKKNNASWHKSCYLKCNKTKLLRAQIKANRPSTSQDSHSSPMKTRRLSDTKYDTKTCIFCGLRASNGGGMRRVSTHNCNNYILENAKLLHDTKLIAKVSERSDLMSLEAEYHVNCYSRFRNRVRKNTGRKESSSPNKRQIHSLAFAGLVSFINEARESNDEPSPVFNMAELTRLYAAGMRDMGLKCDVSSTRLKEKLLEECPYLQACEKPGASTLITFRTDVGCAVRALRDRDFDEEAYALCEAAKTVRADLFRIRHENSTNSDTMHKETIPPSLHALVKMIIDGPSLKKDLDIPEVDENCKAVDTIAQLLAFHTVKSRKGSNRRHSKAQETPVPVYTAMKLYGDTRMKKLIDVHFKLGMSISYDRLHAIITEKANEVCSLYHDEGVVCPPALQKSIFTTAAVDNIDHNTSSTSAMSSFHGTAITLMQHFKPNETALPRLPQPACKEIGQRRSVMELPEYYSVVPPCFVDVKNAPCTRSEKCTYDLSNAKLPFSEEKAWLEKTASEDGTTWAAYHADLDGNSFKHATKVSLLPLFTEQAHSAAMIKHTINMVTKAIHYLNPGQIPVIVADQPLYALLKQIQFQFPRTHGEKIFFALMGGLHIEMAGLRALGHWVNGSGWVEALVQSDVTTQGRAESLISASHVTRTRYAHQVTVAALYRLQQKAYDAYIHQSPDDDVLSFKEWRVDRCKSVPQFKYWDMTLNFQLVILQFVRATRTGDFALYLQSLRRLAPWFFSIDYTNYARWISVHIRDLVCLEEQHPDLHREFVAGLFVARKSDKPFSAISLDQAHEQMNALIKGDGGMVGLTENKDALRKWMVAGPEIAACVQSFEQEWNLIHDSESAPSLHHSDTDSAKTVFTRNVDNLESHVADLGNPFLEESNDLYNIDSKKIASLDVVNTVMNIESAGELQYLEFVDFRLRKCSKNLMDPVKQNKFPLFNTGSKVLPTTSKGKIASLKNDCRLFSKLYIATSEHRQGDLDTFFAHENQPTPPSLALQGELRSCTKSDLVKCLIAVSPESRANDVPLVHAKIIDGAAMVHMLSPGQSRTFEEYARNVVLPFLKRELQSVLRVDVVWDKYDPESLKNWTRAGRGAGQRTKVTPTTRIPKGWPNFLRNSENKVELFTYLAAQILLIKEDGKEMYTTLDSAVASSSGRTSLHSLSPCNHEEADTRMMVHIADAVQQGHSKILLRTVDTDVLVLAVSIFPLVSDLEELWVHLGTGRNHNYVAAHRLAEDLGTEKALALALFHSFSGCDTVSSFGGKGKKTAFEAWKAYPDATTGFLAAREGDFGRSVPYLEKLVIAMYDRSSNCTSVNECRKELFTKKGRQLEAIPPTEDALRQHIRRAMYQGVHIWGQAMTPTQNLPSPSEWGWTKGNDGWTPLWTTLPVASKVCLELIRCGCKDCASRPHQCSCRKRQLKCTELCACDAKCA